MCAGFGAYHRCCRLSLSCSSQKYFTMFAWHSSRLERCDLNFLIRWKDFFEWIFLDSPIFLYFLNRGNPFNPNLLMFWFSFVRNHIKWLPVTYENRGNNSNIIVFVYSLNSFKYSCKLHICKHTLHIYFLEMLYEIIKRFMYSKVTSHYQITLKYL